MKNVDEKKIILHIGLHKTGSTFIQSHLNLIDDDNYRIYLKKSQIVILIIKYLKEPNDNNKEEILSIINKEERKNILISSEEIFEKPNHEFKDVSKRFKLLEELFNNHQIFINKIICSNYAKLFTKNKSCINVCESGLKLVQGVNKQEVAIVPRKLEKKGFFERLFHFFK